ncbi:hypothetical protein GE115_04470 [Agromyces sp. CFH 90414]|uniref:Uncharacterized protein n=1 Tax=Agromyces agglutinans TaxID=2662258 RepID=A0A6I2F0Z8_9MICO|nr:hypothetical protein [Agromyces agglutinans]MRG59125.1 hypothetical protein [Agromyces agglutinans]
MQRSTRFTAVAAALAAAALAMVPIPASAAPNALVEHWDEASSGLAQEDFGPGWCEDVVDFEVAYELQESGNAVFRRRGDGNYAGQSTHHFTGRFTNTETGRYVTISSSGINKDQDVTDNGDGTVTITVHDQGHTLIKSDHGKNIVSIGRQYSYFVVVDHNGTPGDYSDDTLEFESDPTKVVGNDHAWDFCEILADHTV